MPLQCAICTAFGGFPPEFNQRRTRHAVLVNDADFWLVDNK